MRKYYKIEKHFKVELENGGCEAPPPPQTNDKVLKKRLFIQTDINYIIVN